MPDLKAGDWVPVKWHSRRRNWGGNLNKTSTKQEKVKESEEPINFKKLGLNAIALRYMDLLLEDFMIVSVEGIKVRVPNPANYFLHKLILKVLARSERSQPLYPKEIERINLDLQCAADGSL